MEEESSSLSSPILDFYSKKNVFITGATGFVGVAILEKLLRDIPDIGRIYILLRTKKGKTMMERLEEMKKNSVFKRLREMELLEERFAKIVPIEGDVGVADLGIRPDNRQLLIDTVHVVIHSAATLDFFENLKETANINLRGTRRLVSLCREMRNLQALLYVSSAYANSYLTKPEEKLYPSPDDPDRILELTDTLPDDILNDLEPSIINKHSNNYTFTKHLAEHEVASVADKFPCGIIRPSMITAAWKEPLPGWTISKNGAQGFFMGASRGIFRRLPMDASVITDYIPVDVVINAIITAGFYINSLKMKNNGQPDELQIFHLTSSTCNPFKYDMISNEFDSFLRKYPSMSAIWYPKVKMVRSLLLFRIGAIFYHFIPALFLDMIMRAFGKRPILIRIHMSVWNSLSTLEKFIFTEWQYSNKQAMVMAKSMHEIDQKKFYIDISSLNWRDYFEHAILGVREYLNKDPLKTLPAARRKLKFLLVLHIILQLLFYFGLWKSIIALTGISNSSAALTLPFLYALFNII